MKENLAFQITNDLLFARVITDDASATEIQSLVQARLSLDNRFRNQPIVHLARGRNFAYPGAPCCAQVGKVACSSTIAEVTCLKCLAGYGNSIHPTGIDSE